MKILIIATSHGELGDTGRKTGQWLESIAIPYYLFKEAGATISFASPLGGPIPLDPKSESIIASNSTIRRFQKDMEAISDLSHSIPLHTLKAADFDMALLPGGHGPMWDFPGNQPLRQLLEDFNRQNKPLGLISHGVSALLHLQTVAGTPQEGADEMAPGAPFPKGRHLTAFSDSEEAVVGLTSVIPFSLESKLIAIGAFYTKGPDFTPFVITDGNIITGQNPASSLEVTRRMLALQKESQKKPQPVLY